MNIKFVVNDYILVWNLLFRASISETVHKLKQKLWMNYKKEYNDTYKDKNLMLKDIKNYIPNDDTIYNIVLETKEYQRLKKDTEKYRLELLKVWDKKLNSYLKKILKKEPEEYTIFLVGEQFDVLESISSQDKTSIILGKKLNKQESRKIMVDVVMSIVKKELKEYKDHDKLIADAIVEMAIYNELATNLTNNSHYFMGKEKLTYIKRQIYPYWLMYLGISKEDMPKYMLRDKIAFDLEKYPYEKQLIKYELEEFIDFCIRHKRYIIREERLDLI